MAGKDKVIELPKAQVTPLANWLVNQRLAGAVSRARTRFVKILSEEIKMITKEREEILDKYRVEVKPDKKQKKEAPVDNSVPNTHIPEDKIAEATKELEELYQEKFRLSITPENREYVAKVQHILLNTDYVFGADENMPQEQRAEKIREMNDYEVWCDAFEKA